MKKVLGSLIIAFLLASCGAPAPFAAPTLLPPSPAPQGLDPAAALATPVCIDPAPVQADVDRALGFSGGLFEGGDWERTYTVATDKVIVSWYSASLPSVVNLEALIFYCGYEEPDLDYFFSVDSWSIIFGNYQSYQYLNECRNDNGLRLYTFNATDQGVTYQVRYWVVNDTPTRVLTLMIVLPAEATAKMDEFAYVLFPQLVSCP